MTPKKWEEAGRQMVRGATGDRGNQAESGESWTAGRRVGGRQRHPGQARPGTEPRQARRRAWAGTEPRCPRAPGAEAARSALTPGRKRRLPCLGGLTLASPGAPRPMGPSPPARGAPVVQRCPPPTHWKPPRQTALPPQTLRTFLRPTPRQPLPAPWDTPTLRAPAQALPECCPQEGLSTRTCKRHLIWKHVFEDGTELKVLK